MRTQLAQARAHRAQERLVRLAQARVQIGQHAARPARARRVQDVQQRAAPRAVPGTQGLLDLLGREQVVRALALRIVRIL